MGEELAALPLSALRSLDLEPELEEALLEYGRLASHEARRRHMQYIGRLMRECREPERLRQALDSLGAPARHDAAHLARVEELRNRLLADDDPDDSPALEEALAANPALNRQKLAHLIRAARSEAEKKRPPRHFRELFRYLRDTSPPSSTE